MKEAKVNVMGVEYALQIADESTDPVLDGRDGYCDTTVKRCVVDAMNKLRVGQKENMGEYQNSVARHEIIHAFLYESGLDVCSFGANEEMVDWLAIQFPKLLKAFKEADAL